jgi:hypothetical protein
MAEQENKDVRREEVYSRAIRAGKRTYFFDVKETRAGERYLTITESKRRFNNDQGKFYYEKHKVFLYQEDFDKFKDGLDDVVSFITSGEEVAPEKEKEEKPEPQDDIEKISNAHTDVEFEDLGPTDAEKEEDD